MKSMKAAKKMGPPVYHWKQWGCVRVEVVKYYDSLSMPTGLKAWDHFMDR